MAQYHRTLPTTPRDILTIPPKGPTRSNRKGWADQQKPHAHKPTIKITGNRARPTSVHQWIQAKGPGSRAAGVAMAYKLIEAAQARWRVVNAPHLVALVRNGAVFHKGKLLERPVDITAAAPAESGETEVA